MGEPTFDEFQAIYGPIRALSPQQAAELFAGAPFRWWVAGGWSVELGDAPRRTHEDLEVAVPRRDLAALRQWLREYHLWDTHAGTLTFVDDRCRVPRHHEQLWMRRDAHSPWLLDLMLTPVVRGTWFYKRDRRVSRKISMVVRTGRDGVPYQRAEITLLYKARRLADKDDQDFAAIAPTLDAGDRAWLRQAILMTEPAGHPWVERL